jgi:hypothetical protein
LNCYDHNKTENCRHEKFGEIVWVVKFYKGEK